MVKQRRNMVWNKIGSNLKRAVKCQATCDMAAAREEAKEAHPDAPRILEISGTDPVGRFMMVYVGLRLALWAFLCLLYCPWWPRCCSRWWEICWDAHRLDPTQRKRCPTSLNTPKAWAVGTQWLRRGCVRHNHCSCSSFPSNCARWSRNKSIFLLSIAPCGLAATRMLWTDGRWICHSRIVNDNSRK